MTTAKLTGDKLKITAYYELLSELNQFKSKVIDLAPAEKELYNDLARQLKSIETLITRRLKSLQL